MSVPAVVRKYNASASSVYKILQMKEKTLADYGSTGNLDQKNFSSMRHGEINRLVLEWYEELRAQGITVTGPMTQEKARELADCPSTYAPEFKASNGWLDSFKKRNGISYSTAYNRSNKLVESVAGYDSKDIASCGETALFYKLLPQASAKLMEQKCAHSEFSNDRLTVLLCVFADGACEKPLVIGKQENPKCFQFIDKDELPVTWRWNNDAWMTTLIMEQWLRELNDRMAANKRKILLLMDSATSRPKMAFSNIKLIFPPNQQQKNLQPLQQGIFDSFKVTFRERLLSHVLCQTQPTVSYFDAIFWIAESVKSISPSFVSECFGRAKLPIASRESPGSSWTYEKQKNDLVETVSRLMPGLNADDYIHIDDQVYTRNETIEFFSMKTEAIDEEGEDDEQECETVSHETALQNLMSLKTYFAQSGKADVVSSIMELIRSVQGDIKIEKIEQAINGDDE